MASPLPIPSHPDIHVVIEDDDNSVRVDPATGTIEVDRPDGGVDVHLDAQKPDNENDPEEWFANLVHKIADDKLGLIGQELHDAISADDRSREGSLANYQRGLTFLGLELKDPESGVGDSSTAVQGQSKVTNPLLLEAVLKGWANAQSELLPASGPVKIKDDGDETAAQDDLADAYERDWNHWFTTTAKEYYPDTRHMLLWGTYFKGKGFKKVYRCPMRRRPVSESVDAKDLIVSDAMKDLRSCGRITHQISMRPSVMKRMKHIGAYRDVELTQPTPQPDQVDSKIGAIQGTQQTKDRPEDQPYTVWESQCELDLDEFLPGGHPLKGEGIPVPFVVTMDKDSRAILALRRDWNEDDEDCERRRMYVEYPYIPGPGFLGTGLLNILGNASAAMTTAWRLTLDSGQFANFAGGLMAKLAGRQNTSDIRVGPGQFAPVETGGMKIQDVVMPMPYKDVTSGILTLMDKITQQAQAVGGTADIPTAEGIQNVPVGTMLAQIEQATKVEAAVHKGMHTAQSEELELLKDLFRERPEDFWRSNKICPKNFWNEQKFLQALDDCDLVPVSDPNVPSHIHRVAKALALVQLIAVPAFTPHMDAKETLIRCLRVIREDPNGLVIDPPPMPMSGPPQDPAKMLAAQASMIKAQTGQADAQTKAQQAGAESQLEATKLATEKQIADTNLQREVVIHAHDADREQRQQEHDRAVDFAQHGLAMRQQAHDELSTAREHGLAAIQANHDMAMAEREHELAAKQAAKPQPKEKT